MVIKEFLENVCSQIKYKPMREEISEELSLHIQEMKEQYIIDGEEEKEAEKKAVTNMGDATEIGKKLDKIHRPKFDWILFILVGILIGFGFLVSVIKGGRENSDICKIYLEKHAIFIIIGMIFSIGVYFLDYRKIIKNYKIIYTLSAILSIISPLYGYSVNEVRSWIHFYGFCIDTSNICLVLFIISFIGMIINLDKKVCNISIEKLNFKFRIDILKLVVLSVISVLLITFIRGIIMAIVLMLSYLIITTCYIISVKEDLRKNLLKLYGGLISLGIILIILSILSQNGLYNGVLTRIESTYNYQDDIYINRLIGYKINDVLKNANMFSGLDNMEIYFGLFDGGTNHALITIIAYYGIAFAIVIISTIILLAIKLIIDYRKVKDTSGKLLIIGLGSMILIQAIFNILMNLNLIPMADINLPFISYGRNGLLINMISTAFILSIYRRKDILTKNEKQKKIKFKISYE